MPSAKPKQTSRPQPNFPTRPTLHSLEEVRRIPEPGARPFCKSFVNDLVMSGKLPTIRIGRRRFVTDAVFQKILAEGLD